MNYATLSINALTLLIVFRVPGKVKAEAKKIRQHTSAQFAQHRKIQNVREN